MQQSPRWRLMTERCAGMLFIGSEESFLSAQIRRRRRLLSKNPISEMLKITLVVHVYLLLCYK